MTTRNMSASYQPSNLCWWSAHILFTSSHPLYTLHCSILANSMCWCCTRLDCHWTNFLNLILSDPINSLTPSSLWQEQHGLSTPGTLPAHFFSLRTKPQQCTTIFNNRSPSGFQTFFPPVRGAGCKQSWITPQAPGRKTSGSWLSPGINKQSGRGWAVAVGSLDHS